MESFVLQQCISYCATKKNYAVLMIQLTEERAALNFVLWFDKNMLIVILSYS